MLVSRLLKVISNNYKVINIILQLMLLGDAVKYYSPVVTVDSKKVTFFDWQDVE